MYKVCTGCNKNFHVAEGEEWKKTCLGCWKKTKNVQDKNYQRVLQLEALAQLLYQRIAKFEKHTAELERKTSSSIEPDMLRRLIMLSHPDRHNNSEASKKATQFLLDMKKNTAQQ